MKLEVLGETITVHFRHDWSGTETQIHRGDCAKLAIDENPKPPLCAIGGWAGRSYLHPNDQPNRAVGRKIALANALRLMDRPWRKEFWKAYIASGVKLK